MTQQAANIRTIQIGMSRQCPSLQPPTGSFTHEGKTFTVQQLEIVGAALDEGLFDSDAFKAFCRAKWEQAHPSVDRCLTADEPGGVVLLPNDGPAKRAILDAYTGRLASEPRGTWAMFERKWGDAEWGGTVRTIIIAQGNGACYTPQLGSCEGLPTYAMALAKMVGYEIYLARHAEQARRELVRSRAVARGYGWDVGSALKNISVGAASYSSAVITEILETGHLVLHATKRGSRNRWECTVLAQAIGLKDGQTHAPAYGQIVATEA